MFNNTFKYSVLAAALSALLAACGGSNNYNSEAPFQPKTVSGTAVDFYLANATVQFDDCEDANGQPVNQILVEAATDIAKELYLGAVVDRSSRRVVFMASTEGGVEIEKVAEETPHLIHKVAIDPLAGPMPYQGRELAFKLGLEGKLVQQFTKIFMGLANIFLERDLALIEINPLVITTQGDLICLDGKLGADGNALFRQPDLREMRDQSQEDPREAQAARYRLESHQRRKGRKVGTQTVTS